MGFFCREELRKFLKTGIMSIPNHENIYPWEKEFAAWEVLNKLGHFL
jgi:hypothetical protein